MAALEREGTDVKRNGLSDGAGHEPAMRSSSVASACGIAGLLLSATAAGAQLTAHVNQSWHQNSSGVPGVVASGDRFGSAQAVGDFNADGYMDLAVGARGDEVSGVIRAGGVNVFYGTSSGLSAAGAQHWVQGGALGLPGAPELDDALGEALAAGDFDGDGADDLAIGVPGEGIGATFQAGAVMILYGRHGVGLQTVGQGTWHQDTAGVLGVNANSDRFGSALVVGDFDGDDLDDLAIGGPDGGDQRGAVWVLYGTQGVGLTTGGHQQWTQDSSGVLGTAENNDLFGLALAAGDLDGDGYDDLAVSAAWEEIQSADQGGVVHILYGGSGGLSATDNQLWWQGSNGLPEAAEDFDLFGFKLSSADFDGDGYGDLAIAASGEDYNDVEDAGVVIVMYGASSGLSASGSQLWHQDVPGVEDEAEQFDRLGRSLSAGDFNADGFADLVMGLPHEDIGALANAGATHVVYGSPSGLTAAGSQFWHQDVSGILGGSEQGDNFGASLVAADFDGNGSDDLSIGVDLESIGAVSSAGAINVLYGLRPQLHEDGFETGDFSMWFRAVSD